MAEISGNGTQRPGGVLSGEIRFPAGAVTIGANLTLPDTAAGLGLLICRRGTGPALPQTRVVAQHLEHAGYGTLIFDVAAAEELHAERRLHVDLMAQRLAAVTSAVRQRAVTRDLPIGYYGTGTRAAAALIAAAMQPDEVMAVVCQGARTDLAVSVLPKIRAATLLITEPDEHALAHINHGAMRYLRCEKSLQIAGSIRDIAELTQAWFHEHVRSLAAV
jgi:putative phosphoribosyl transferase